jgi:hypothetical protein
MKQDYDHMKEKYASMKEKYTAIKEMKERNEQRNETLQN